MPEEATMQIRALVYKCENCGARVALEEGNFTESDIDDIMCGCGCYDWGFVGVGNIECAESE